MPQVETQTGICASCGALTDTSLLGDELTCMACLLRLGFTERKCYARDDSLGLSVPDHIGPYVIARRDDGSPWQLGHGAMGITFRATDESLQRPVALKIINANLGSRGVEARERFTREARAAGALRHPNVAMVYQFGVREETGQFFYAMELVEGETLEERVRRLGPLDVLTTIDIALQVAAALAAAEERGLVHRDLKPGNLMLVGGDNEVVVGTNRRAVRRTSQRDVPAIKVIDFGVAKAVAEKTNAMSLTHGGFVGTPAFASPEQFTNTPVDVRSDIYSLGATLWFALTGHMLFSGRTVEEIRDARRSQQLPIEQLKAARVSHRFITLLRSMLAIEPAARPASARVLAAKLEAIRASITGRRKSVQRFAVAAAVVALTTIVAVRLFHSTPPKATAAAIPEKSIALLPFENRSEDKANAYFAEAIQDEILTRLSKIADLKVISCASTQQFQSKPANLSEIAKQLGVANILEGSVQRSADQVRVNVQLIKAATDAHLWADTFDRKLTDIFAVESDIATAIAETLQAKLTGSERAAIAKRPTENPEAHEFYLKGRFFWNKRTGADLWTAIEYFNEALNRDPSYALAYAGLADSYTLLEPYGAASAADSFPHAKAAAKKALELDDTLAEAHTALANALSNDWNFAESIREFQRAIELNPNYPTAHQWYGETLGSIGRFDEGIAELKRAKDLDPLSLVINANVGEVYIWARRCNEAIEQLHKTIEMDPRFYYAHWNLGMALQLKGQLDEAIAEYRKAAELNDDPSVLALVGQAYARAGQREEAQKILARLGKEAKSRYVPAYSFALMYLALGDKERAIDEMERAYRERAFGLAYTKVDPMLDDLRGHPRFEALVEKVFAPKNGASP